MHPKLFYHPNSTETWQEESKNQNKDNPKDYNLS